MRKGMFSLLLILMLVSVSSAQNHRQILERVKQITLLTDDSWKVRERLYDLIADNDPTDESDDFEMDDLSIEVFYSTGTCDEDEEEIWDVPAGKAYRIELKWYSDVTAKDLGVDLAKLKKEQIFSGNEVAFIYHDKAAGFAVEIDEGKVEKVTLIPSKNSKVKLCDSKFAKEFISHKSWFGSVKLEDRPGISDKSGPANVTELELSIYEVLAINSPRVSVSATANDPENDPLIYNYTVSAGKIVGSGAKVIWDLSGVGPGKYTITAGVDDGCGICGQTKTQVITIK